MAVISSIDGLNRRIFLSIDTVGVPLQPMDIYTEMRSLRRTNEELRKYDVYLAGRGYVSKGGGKFTPRYVECLGGTRIVPYDAEQKDTTALAVIGEIITDDAQSGTACFDRSSLVNLVEIDYQPPQVEIIEVGGGDIPDVNIARVNGMPVKGMGTEADPWGPDV